MSMYSFVRSGKEKTVKIDVFEFPKQEFRHNPAWHLERLALVVDFEGPLSRLTLEIEFGSRLWMNLVGLWRDNDGGMLLNCCTRRSAGEVERKGGTSFLVVKYFVATWEGSKEFS